MNDINKDIYNNSSELLLGQMFNFIILTDSSSNRASWQWERYWMRYAIAMSSVTATALTLAGCLCCQRHRRPKGFQVT